MYIPLDAYYTHKYTHNNTQDSTEVTLTTYGAGKWVGGVKRVAFASIANTEKSSRVGQI